jgi:hypothetical protein
MARHWKVILFFLIFGSVAGLVTLPGLLESLLRLRRADVTQQQARREIVQPPVATPTDAFKHAQFFWISATSPLTLSPDVLELPLSTEPVQRSKQLLTALITQVPAETQRTLPLSTEVLALYLLADGTAILDFSDHLPTELPSGILSEYLAVDSIVRTLAANVPAVRAVKILIRGQEPDTLAGHLDLSLPFPAPSPSSSQAALAESNSLSSTLP